MRLERTWMKSTPSVVVIVIMLVHTVLLSYTAVTCSPTFDEAAYLPAGLSHWHLGRFELYRACPHLVRLVAAIPVLFTDATTDWTHFSPGTGRIPAFTVGRDFINANGSDVHRYFVLARLACIPFSLLGAWMCYYWAKELYGVAAGVLALLVWCFDPNLIAHGSLITADVATTSLGILGFYLFWKWLKEPTVARTLAAGTVLGLLLLTRMNALLLLGFWPALWVGWRIFNSPVKLSIKGQLGQLACMLVLAVNVLNVGYLGDGSFRRLGAYRFISQSLSGPESPGNRFAGTWLGDVPAPFPASYVLGVDALKRGFESNRKLAYLGGEFQKKGWRYYYLYGLLVKVPLGTWALVLLGATIGWRYRTHFQDELFLLVPAASYLAFMSLQLGLNSHVRYVMPIAPFVFISTSKLASAWSCRHRMVSLAVAASLLALLASSLRIVPHGLSYFNELAGGPLRGHDHLLDSNIDWGQDLRHLEDWLDRNPDARPIGIAYFGSYSPSDIGIPFQLPPTHPPLPDALGAPLDEVGPRPGYYAVSVNFLRGYRFKIYGADGRQHWLSKPYLTYFQRLEPIDRAGYSIYIYRISQDDAERLRKELGYPPLMAKAP